MPQSLNASVRLVQQLRMMRIIKTTMGNNMTRTYTISQHFLSANTVNTVHSKDYTGLLYVMDAHFAVNNSTNLRNLKDDVSNS